MSNIIGIRNNNTIVPYVSAQKRTKEVNLTVTGTNWTTSNAVGRAYADSNGVWRFVFNIIGTFSSGTSSATLTVAGVTFNSVIQAIAAYDNSVGDRTTQYARTNASASTILVGLSSTTTQLFCSGDVLLASEPTWAAANMEGVVAVDVYIPPASATEDGIVNRSAQTFAEVKTFNDGVKLKNEAGQTALTYSRIDVVSFYIIDGAGNSSTGANCYVTRIGNVVTIQFPEKTLTNTGTDRFISTSSDGTTKSWPDWLTPTSVTAQSTCVSVKGTQFIPGVLSVSPSQVFIIYADCAGSTFGASNEAKGVFVCTVTYLLN